ncbi:MAG: methyltransferase domain-containing protein [Myxococcota bacterium]|jgi:SAM-dependent methyltransferase|nr:methyltransferase domain-containing protein [Myxococcota bacterium]
MGFYERHILPHVIDKACGSPAILKQRQKIVPNATGRVLEVGMGSGINLQYYDKDNVEFVFGLEPSEGMRNKAQKNLTTSPVEVRWLDLPGEEIPLDDKSVDTIVLTFTLCTIPDWRAATEQMRRVLKPGGTMLFCEHGEAPDEDVRRWQDRLNPLWNAIAGGCHLNRPIPGYLEDGGFKIETLETRYLPATPRFAGFNYWGSASVR